MQHLEFGWTFGSVALACTGMTCLWFSSWFPLWNAALRSAGKTSGTSSRKPWRSSCSFSVRCGVPPTHTGGLSFHRRSSSGPACASHCGLAIGSWNHPLMPFLKCFSWPMLAVFCRNSNLKVFYCATSCVESAVREWYMQEGTHAVPACALPPSLAERGLKMGPKAGEESG